MRTLTKALLGATMLTAAGAAHAQITNAEALDANETVVENAMKVQNFSTLVAAVEAAGLADDLMGPGPFTVFAPLDSAFEQLPEGTVDSLLMPENRDQLERLLQAHVVPGTYTTQQFELALLDAEDNTADPAFQVVGEGDEAYVVLDALDAVSNIYIEQDGPNFYVSSELDAEGEFPLDDNYEIIAGDIASSNGVIHAINGVLMPTL